MPGKVPGKVRKLELGQGKVRELMKCYGNILVRRKLL